MATQHAQSNAFNNLVSSLRQSTASTVSTPAAASTEPLISDRTDSIPPSSPHVPSAPSWDWTCLELVRLLQQYPAGVSAAVMETQLLTQWQNQKWLPPSIGSSSPDGRGARNVPRLVDLLRTTPAGSPPVTVSGVCAALDSVLQQPGAPTVLELRDGSLKESQPTLGLYLHSRYTPLFCGADARVAAGTLLRLGTCRLHRAPQGSGTPPRLLPVSEMVLVASEPAEAASWLAPLAISSVAQVVSTVRVEAGQMVTLTGVLAARIARVDPLHEGLRTLHGLSSRSGRSRSILLEDSDASEGGHNVELELRLLDDQVIYAELLKPGELVYISNPTIGLTLPNPSLDSTRSRESSQHGPGLCVEVSSASVVCVIPTRQLSSLVLNTSNAKLSPKEGISKVVADSEDSAQDSRGAFVAAPSDSRMVEHGVQFTSLLAARDSAAQGTVLVGRVLEMRVASGNGERLSMKVTIQDEVGARLGVQLLFRGQLPPAALALYPGHTAVIAGAVLQGSCPEAESFGHREGTVGVQGDAEASIDAVWVEGTAGALLLSLSALPAVLSTPSLTAAHHPLTSFLPPSSPATAPPHPASPSDAAPSPPSVGVILCQATVASPPLIRWCRVHRLCGRLLKRASLGLEGMFDEDMDEGDTGKPGESVAPATPVTPGSAIGKMSEFEVDSPRALRIRPQDSSNLWRCNFCGVECSSAGVEVAVNASVRLSDAGAALDVALDGAAAVALLGAPTGEIRKHSREARQAQQGRMVGRRLVASLYHAPSTCGGWRIAALRFAQD